VLDVKSIINSSSVKKLEPHCKRILSAATRPDKIVALVDQLNE